MPRKHQGVEENGSQAEADRRRVAARVARNVRATRIARQLTQEALAERIGCTPTYVQGVERGVENFTARMLGAFARGLAVDVAQLLDRTTGRSSAVTRAAAAPATTANKQRKRP